MTPDRINSPEILPPAKTWNDVATRLPKLKDCQNRNLVSLTVLDNGEIKPFENFPSELLIPGQNVGVEVTGGPRATKTSLIQLLNYELNIRGIKNQTYPESGEEKLKDIGLGAYNLSMSHSATKDILLNSLRQVSQPTIYTYDRAAHNALAFSWANNIAMDKSNKVCLSNPRYGIMEKEMVAENGSYMKVLFIFHIDPATSMSRGSQTDESYLKLLSQTLKHLPDDICKIRRDNNEVKDYAPLVVAEVDANQHPSSYPDLFLATYGTIFQKYSEQIPSWSFY